MALVFSSAAAADPPGGAPTGPSTAPDPPLTSFASVPLSTSSGTIQAVIYDGANTALLGIRQHIAADTHRFWGAQWWKRNTLSGGAAPASFKGFAREPATPSCGTDWTTGPGNSPPPPTGPLPAFMGVIVTSSTSKSGSQISGDTVHMVVVETNPGYSNNPGHPGTGTVVAQIC